MLLSTIFLSITSLLAELITNSEQLVKAMYNKYHNNYNKNISFIQKNIEYKENGEKEITTMYEAHHYPGMYRVDYGFIPNKNGFIFGNDSIYHFKDGVLTQTLPGEHDIILLTGDVFYLKPEVSIARIKENDFDISKFRTEMFEGKKTYVVGSSDKKDTLSPQFWIDAENLYLVRLIKKNRITSVVEDAHFVEHAKVGDAWIEDRVIVFSDGKKIREEIYTEVKPNNEFEPELFNPKFWGKVHWHKK